MKKTALRRALESVRLVGCAVQGEIQTLNLSIEYRSQLADDNLERALVLVEDWRVQTLEYRALRDTQPNLFPKD